MKKITSISSLFCAFSLTKLNAQCSLCTKTAGQLGDNAAQGLNTAIVYLMLTPLLIMLIIGYKWWQREKRINNS